jgi:hypothetical protein
MAAPRKGTATPLRAVFSPEETKRAVSRVVKSVADRRAELRRLQGFVADNDALVSLVNRLPDELSHEIMVFHSIFKNLNCRNLCLLLNMILVGCLILYHRFTLFSEMSLKSK